MANEITFDKLPQAVGYLTEQVERIHKIVAALQPQTAIDKHRIVEIDEACQITRKAKPTIYTLARKGIIPAYKRGKKLYFYEDELLKWIEEGRKVISKNPMMRCSPLCRVQCAISRKTDLVYNQLCEL